MRSISLADARRDLPAILDSVEQGQSFVITRHGRPIAEVVPARERTEQQDEAFCVVAGGARFAIDSDIVDSIRELFETEEQLITLGPHQGMNITVASSALDHILVPEPAAARTITRREREIIQLIVHGQSNREIAELLVLSERTVEGHIANIFAKLNVSSRIDVAKYWLRGIKGDDYPTVFRVRTRLGYEYEARGELRLLALQEAIKSRRERLHEVAVAGGILHIRTGAIASLGVYMKEVQHVEDEA